MKMFVLNGNSYPIKDMSVNMICDLEDMGISLGDMQKKSFSFIRAYVSMCMGESPEKAGKEIELHLINKGKLEDVMDAVKTAMEESDFFRALQTNTDEETSTSKTEKK